MRNPEIYGGSGICVVYPLITKEKLYQCLAKTKGSRGSAMRSGGGWRSKGKCCLPG